MSQGTAVAIGETKTMTKRQLHRVPIAAILLCSALVSGCAADETPLPQGNVASGKALVEARCSACHALDADLASPHKDAPPFPLINQRVVIENLAEALAEGIGVGHRDMPEFVFEPAEIDDILAYLESIQVMPAPE